MVGQPKTCVTLLRFPRLIRGCCSIGRGRKYVLFLRITFRIHWRSLEREIVTEAELTCKELTELITDYLEEHLSQADRVRFEQHLSVCPGCIAYLDQMRATIKTIGARPRIDVPPAIQSSLLEAFRRWKNS